MAVDHFRLDTPVTGEPPHSLPQVRVHPDFNAWELMPSAARAGANDDPLAGSVAARRIHLALL